MISRSSAQAPAVRAIKNGANRPPLSASSSDLLISHEGRVISNKPKNDNAKTKNITKNTKFGIQWVPIRYITCGPKMSESITPSTP